MISDFSTNQVVAGDCRDLIPQLPDDSIDVVVTSPPYWGQRVSIGHGIEEDPRDYLMKLTELFALLLPKLKTTGLLWINIGDAYNTPVNWRSADHEYSTLGPQKIGLGPANSAYQKPRHQRKAFINSEAQWLRYGNLLALPYRLALALTESGYLFRGEVIWRKKNPMPEGRCRRPHRQHESIYLFARSEQHNFRTSPPVGSVWEISHQRINGRAHYSRFPEELPRRCIEAYGQFGPETVVLDPFNGSGMTGVAAVKLGCTYLGFEIDPDHVTASNARLREIRSKSAIDHIGS